MYEIPILFRMVREALGISQKEVAKKAGVSAPAVAQWEDRKMAVSFKKALSAAPLLGLDADYLETGLGKPFKKSGSHTVKPMTVAGDESGKPDFSLVQFVMAAHAPIELVLLTPPLEAIRSGLKTPGSFYALLVRDVDGMIFLFRGKNARLPLYSIKDWIEGLSKAHPGAEVPCKTTRLANNTYRNIRKGVEVSIDELNGYFESAGTNEYRELLWEIVGKLWLDEDSVSDYQMMVWALSPEEAKKIVEKTLPKMRTLLAGQLDKVEHKGS
jgi:transcriptional regulator with XRE-family HTH domain